MPMLRSGKDTDGGQWKGARGKKTPEPGARLAAPPSVVASTTSRRSSLEEVRHRHEAERAIAAAEQEAFKTEQEAFRAKQEAFTAKQEADEARRRLEEMKAALEEEEHEGENQSVVSERSRRTEEWVSRSSYVSVRNFDHYHVDQSAPIPSEVPVVPVESHNPHRHSPPPVGKSPRLNPTQDHAPVDVNIPFEVIKGWVARKKLKHELPNFEGDPTQWPLFLKMFERSTAVGDYNEEENLLRLQKALKGEAKECVNALLTLPGSLPLILDRLKRRFGKPDLIVKKVMAKLEQVPSMGEAGLVGLEKMAGEMENAVGTIILLGRDEYLFNPTVLDSMVGKLNVYLRLQWAEYALRFGDGPVSLEKFSEWIQGRADLIGNVGEEDIQKIQSTSEKNEGDREIKNKPSEESRRACLFCESTSHSLDACQRFVKMAIEERVKWARRRFICFLCLRKGHRGVHCKAKISCKTCGKRHNSLLHLKEQTVGVHREDQGQGTDVGRVGAGDDTREPVLETTAVNVNAGGKILLRVLPVVLQGPKKTVKTYAFLDNGSTVTMLDEKLARELGLSGPKKPLRVSWSNDTIREEEQSCEVTMSIAGVQGEAKQYPLTARTVKQLVLPTQSVDHKALGIECTKLVELEISSFENAKPMLLIGEDNWPLTVPLKVVHGSWNGPVATKTRLGWVVHGRVPKRVVGRVKEDTKPEKVEHVHQLTHWQEDVEGREERIIKEILAEYVVKEDPNEEKAESAEDERARAIFEETTRKVEGRWETGLLWKNNDALPESYPMALRRLLSLERKMDKDPAYGKRYVEKMEEGMVKGYITKLTEDDKRLPSKREWYLPHLGVINPNKPAKLRICFDASAKANGVSLNDMLITGPDLLVSIPGLLCRFREGRVAFSGDIKEMFPQIRIKKEDQMAQKFLWRGMERKSPPEVFVVRVMTFGAKCSPFLAQEVKNKNARDMEDVELDIVKAIVRNHYMDDYLDSCADEDQGIHRVLEVLRVHRQGGFVMCNWISNSDEVLQAIPEELRSPKSTLELGEAEKLLGMWWCPKTDDFHFKVKFDRIPEEVRAGRRRPTKREILKCVMTLYDPLGLIMAVVIEGKILLQEVWKTTPEWDKEVNSEQGREWDQWLAKLKAVEQLKIPRWYGVEGATDVQLHVMCDASERAYAAVAYIRLTTTSQIAVKLVYAKARVTKVNEVSKGKKEGETIPRLELQAAVTASQVAKCLIQEHRISLSRVVFWSDARIVLGWIRSGEKARLPAYVQRRVDKIREVGPPEMWRWVPTKENCADDATRGSKRMKLEVDGRWFQGPEFLWQEESMWPQEEPREVKTADASDEFVGIVREKEGEILPEVGRFSQWNRLVRTAAWIPRLAKYWKTKEPRWLEELTVDEIAEAEEKCIRQAQADSFQEEIDAIRAKKPIGPSSRLAALDPFMDDRGFLRAGGRLEAATEMSYDTRHPLLLASEHPFTRMLVMKYHRWARHQGQETILNAIRQRFWITNARRAVRSSFNRCGLCQLKRAKTEHPKMAPLPKARVTHGTRPFTSVGLDYFGPVFVTVGRRTEKRYVALFTCLAVRAVHLEVASDLTSGAAIMAIRRFAARRGSPSEIYSDNGSNFRKADKELKEALEEISQEEMVQGLTMKGIRWKFNCPLAPHMGGAWERMVRTVKTALGAALKEEKPREEVLTTLLAEVEMVVNSRPLTHVSVDPQDLTCLTPNHFLIGEANGGPVCTQVPPEVPLRALWKRSQQLADVFWKRWVKEYVPTLNQRDKWRTPTTPLAVGDYVVIGEDNYPRGQWPKGVVTAVDTSKDGQVRAAHVRTAHGTYQRPAVRLMKMTLMD